MIRVFVVVINVARAEITQHMLVEIIKLNENFIATRKTTFK